MAEIDKHKLKVLGVIPARGGSKTIPRKNIIPFAGKPLIAWTIECALEGQVAASMVLSTDDPEIAHVGEKFGVQVPFIRPPDLAKDETPTAPVVQHALRLMEKKNNQEYEYVIILEPTSPARRPEHIRGAMQLLVETGADSVSGISEVPHHYSSQKILKKNAENLITGINDTPISDMIHRRQDLPVEYAFNGIVWACRAELLRNKKPSIWGKRNLGFVIDPKYAIDLDILLDWEIGELRMQKILAEEPEFNNRDLDNDI